MSSRLETLTELGTTRQVLLRSTSRDYGTLRSGTPRRQRSHPKTTGLNLECLWPPLSFHNLVQPSIASSMFAMHLFFFLDTADTGESAHRPCIPAKYRSVADPHLVMSLSHALSVLYTEPIGGLCLVTKANDPTLARQALSARKAQRPCLVAPADWYTRSNRSVRRCTKGSPSPNGRTAPRGRLQTLRTSACL